MIDDPVLINDWHPVAALDQFTDRDILPVRLLGEDLVIWKTGSQYLAWQDLCVHRGARLSLGRTIGESLQCPYHGWTYDTGGRCVHMPAHPEQTPPARAQVKPYRIKEGYGLLWACLGEPANDLPPFPEWGQSGFARAVCGPFPHVRAHGPRLIENYLDAAHFPFVHAGMLGDPARAAMEDYETRLTPAGVESDPIWVYQPDPYGGAPGRVSYTYHAYRPLSAHFTKHMPAVPAVNGMMLTLTPHDPLDTTAWFIVATTARTDEAALKAEYTPRIGRIFEEDRAIVESQRPELLPLDLQAELHLKSDRVAIAYRNWLKELGLKFGAT
jgi:phenylpropionate dioxygenase-like ring-hydroxylating dioxygenase large terminal subunit